MDSGELTPVVDDMSAYILGGRVTDARLGVAQSIDAERLGFRRVWISERYNMKECGVLFGAIAASTSRIEVGTGAMTIGARPPIVTASIAATLHSGFGPRCNLGLGLGTAEFNRPHGLRLGTYDQLVDYADIIARLFRGETVDYSGPAGTYEGLVFPDPLTGPAPRIWHVQLGGPKACAVSVTPAFDGAMIGFISTPTATRNTVAALRAACERTGRDPSTLRIAVPVPTAPAIQTETSGSPLENPTYGKSGGLVTFTTLKVFTAMFMTQPSTALGVVRRNGWDEGVVKKIGQHPLLCHDDDLNVDFKFRDREQDALLELAELVPDEWIEEACGYGSTADCVRKLQEFKDAGVDEIATYTSSPAQNAEVIAAWRARPEASN